MNSLEQQFDARFPTVECVTPGNQFKTDRLTLMHREPMLEFIHKVLKDQREHLIQKLEEAKPPLWDGCTGRYVEHANQCIALTTAQEIIKGEQNN